MIPRFPFKAQILAYGWRSRTLLFLAFAFICAAFIAADYAVVYQLQPIESNTHTIVENMLTSVELVSRIGRDIARERRLIDMHILETQTTVMQQIEQEMAEVRVDFSKSANAYRPLITLTGELATWQRLESSVQAMRAPINELIALSRKNEDVEARAKLEKLEPQFDEITDDVDDLIQINRQGAERQVQSVIQLQRSVTTLQTFLSFFGVAVTLVVGWWAIHLIGQREEQLERNTEMLAAQNRDLDAFAGRVAHDLRNPLSTVNLAGMRLAKYVPPEDEAAMMLKRGVNRMDSLIRDLLALSKAESSGEEVCDPAKAIAGVWDDLSSRLERDGGTIRSNVAPATVRGSEVLLRQAVWNLVDNAVKYRRKDVAVHVDLSGRIERKIYELRVSDNGIGMAPDEYPKAFDPFYRARRSGDVAGTGLGLSIVKRVVEASGGTISVYSQLGQGATFIINLQVAEENHSQVSSSIDGVGGTVTRSS